MINIKRTNSNFNRSHISSLGSKGGYLSELGKLWFNERKQEKSTVWGAKCMPKVFTSNSQSAGNSMMYLLTEYALQKAKFIF